MSTHAYNMSMNIFNLEQDFTRGWVIGAFANPILQTDQFEVCIKNTKAGFTEPLHYHKLTKEITIVISGVVEMCGRRLVANDIIVLEPNEVSSFKCIEDATTCAIRNGSYPKDKYEVDESQQLPTG
jgi:quercetin dioxygenase-like cupin family protein